MIRKFNGDKSWSHPSQDASEVELHDFLYGLVRLVKPEVVIETGCYHGDATVTLGRALKANGRGMLYTCDIDRILTDLVRMKVSGEDLPVVVKCCPAEELIAATEDVELAFIDSGWERAKEAAALQLKRPAYVVLHDAHTQEYPSFDAVKALGWTAMKFDTSVGVGFFEVR